MGYKQGGTCREDTIRGSSKKGTQREILPGRYLQRKQWLKALKERYYKMGIPIKVLAKKTLAVGTRGGYSRKGPPREVLAEKIVADCTRGGVLY